MRRPTRHDHRPDGRRHSLAWVAAVVLLALVGCGEPDPAESAPALTRGEFIAVLVALRNAEREVAFDDSAASRFEARRDSILAAHGTTPEELHAFLDLNPDLQYQDALWDSLTQRLKRPLESPRQGSPVTERGEAGDGPPARLEGRLRPGRDGPTRH